MPVLAREDTRLVGWLDAARRHCDMAVEPIPWRASREWRFDGYSLHHDSGGFFRLVGAQRPGEPGQPLIDQPEIGILGFLTRRRGGTREVCLQAKPEPGNVGLVQAAPSVQATESNYRQVHRGRPTPLLAHFVDPPPETVLADSLQSEQGTRFLAKRNRNMVVEADAEADHDRLAWFAVPDLLALLATDFQVNTDARSVLATCPWTVWVRKPFGRWEGQAGLGAMLLRSYHAPGRLPDEAVVAHLASARETPGEVVGLADLDGWTLDGDGIQRTDATGFRVRQFHVTTTQREVDRWDQPLITTREVGRAVLLCRVLGGVLELGFRPRHELGFRAGPEYGPAFVDGEAAPPACELLACRHSDEGGRFYRCVARYSVGLAESAPGPEEDGLVWMTLGQVARLMPHPGVFTNEARSLVSMLLAYL